MPIDHLPTETLSLILELVCTQNLFQLKSNHGAYTEILCSPMITYLPALVVSAVCVRWRTLSLVLPGLWAWLGLEIAETATVSNEIMATLQLYLNRSAEAPLHLDPSLEEPAEGTYPPALDLLLKHTCRWKTVRCGSDRELSKDPLFLPILEDLAVEWHWAECPMVTLQCFENAPKIRILSIDDAGHSRGWVDSLRHGLTDLSISLNDKDISMLRDLLNLNVLKLNVIGEVPWPVVDLVKPMPRSFPRVKSFTLQISVYNDNDDCVSNSLDALILPSLSKLIICRENNCDGWDNLVWPTRAFSEFLKRSSCTLIQLFISDIAISDLDLIAALRLSPSLVRLGIGEGNHMYITAQHDRIVKDSGVEKPITPFFLSSLTIRNLDSDPGAVLVPKLQTLSIKVKGTTFDHASFVEMILSRWLPDLSYTAAEVGVASLRSMTLRFCEEAVDKDVYRPLFELDKVGMRWGWEEGPEEAEMQPLGNLKRMGMRVVITGRYHWMNHGLE